MTYLETIAAQDAKQERADNIEFVRSFSLCVLLTAAAIALIVAGMACRREAVAIGAEEAEVAHE